MTLRNGNDGGKGYAPPFCFPACRSSEAVGVRDTGVMIRLAPEVMILPTSPYLNRPLEDGAECKCYLTMRKHKLVEILDKIVISYKTIKTGDVEMK